MAATHTPVVRKAVASDEPAILALVDALADYEKLDRPSPEARRRLMQDMFGPKPRDRLLPGFHGRLSGRLRDRLETYSSFLALPTLYLEDLFVLEEYRKRGVGRALFLESLNEAKRRGCGRMEWTVSTGIRLAIDFYQKIGGKHMAEWQLYRINLV